MSNIDKIMSMLDWNNSLKVQERGVKLGKKVSSFNVFIQPGHPGFTKNVWGNCAKIIVSKTDETLNPYLVELLEWIEDLNWPGALIILERLKEFSKVNMLAFVFDLCVKRASATENYSWLGNMSELLGNHALLGSLEEECLAVLFKSKNEKVRFMAASNCLQMNLYINESKGILSSIKAQSQQMWQEESTFLSQVVQSEFS